MELEINDISDLQRLCDDKAEETTTLEFKTCSELIIGSEFRDKNASRTRTRDDVLNELSKDVSALLNSNGGVIIYGVREKNSKADELDTEKAFNTKTRDENIYPEKVIDWLRAHISPPPFINAIRIPIDKTNPNSPWFLVIQVEQGQTAYQARNKLFYRRTGSTVQPMEQYEVHDVMNRAIVPDVAVQFGYQKLNLTATIHEYRLNVIVKNLSDRIVENFKLQFEFPNNGEGYNTFKKRNDYNDPYFGKITFSDKVDGKYIIEFRSIEKLFPKDEFDVGKLLALIYRVDNNVYSKWNTDTLKWDLYADNMQPKKGEVPFSTLNYF